MIVDPNDEDHLYVLSVRVTESIDGGAEWRPAFNFGGDNHAMWIDPEDSKPLILGHDHGMGVSWDGGESWYHPDDMPLAQFYTVSLDNDFPYNVYGGLQDNGSKKGPSTRPGGGSIRFEDWSRVGGGDGMYNVVDWSNSRWLYNESQFGPINRLDQRRGERRSIRYTGNEDLRWNWNAPILVSPHDSDLIYHGANLLLRSAFRGEAWEEISPDLTDDDPAKIQGTGNIQYCTITVIDESPIMPGQLWVGTDDGNLWVTRDGGENWTNLNDNIPHNPRYWVSRVEASHHDAGTAYVIYTGYRRDDFRSFVYRTTDFGETWVSLAANLPDEPINAIVEDHENPDVLYLGTEFSVWVSIDFGETWQRMRGDMPTQPVHDIAVHEREDDLVVATHGRGIYITDVLWIQELTADVLASEAHLFDIERRFLWSTYDPHDVSSQNFEGESEPDGVTIYYWLRDAIESEASEVASSETEGRRGGR